MPCLDDDELVRFTEGLLSPQERAAVEAHLDACESCRRLLADLAQVFASGTPPGASEGAKSSPSDYSGDGPPETIAVVPGMLLRGTYQIRKIIAGGGMGWVFEAYHRHLDRPCAIKVLRQSRRASLRERFQREARVISQLRHPNIVEVTDFGTTEEGCPFLVMELLRGSTLSRWLAENGPITDSSLLAHIMQGITAALREAHRNGIIHRDVKPSNVFLCSSEDRYPAVKILDFGLSKDLTALDLTSSGELMGTPRYMAPEQLRGQEVGPPTDIHAVGAILHELVTGRPAFEGPDLVAMLYSVAHEVPSTEVQVSALGRAVGPVIFRAMQKNPRKRYQTIEALWEDFLDALRPSSWLGARVRRNRRLWIWAPTCLLLGATAAIAAIILRMDTPPPRGAPDRAPTTAPAASAPPRIMVGSAASRPLSRPRLFLTSRPAGAQVRLGGRVLGRTPLEGIAFTATTDPVEVSMDGYRLWRGRLPPEGDAVLSAVLTPRPPRVARAVPAEHGQLVVQSRSEGKHVWASVYLDGKRVGQTALTLARVPAGRHRIEVRREGFAPASRQIRVSPGKRQVVRFDLTAP